MLNVKATPHPSTAPITTVYSIMEAVDKAIEEATLLRINQRPVAAAAVADLDDLSQLRGIFASEARAKRAAIRARIALHDHLYSE